MNDNELAGLLGLGKSDDSPTLAWGKVTAVSGDTVTANVMGGTVSAVRCCDCSEGDVIALEGQRGRWRAVGRKGGGGGVSAGGQAGVIVPFAGSVVPQGFLACDGAAVSRTTYDKLFAAIGTTWGAGNGTTTFNVPNLNGRTLIGKGGSYALGATGGEASHTLTAGEMAQHNHGAVYLDGNASYPLGFRNSGAGQKSAMWLGNSAGATSDKGFHIAPGLAGSNQPHNNMQPYAAANYIISTGEAGASVQDIIRGVTAIPLGLQYGGTGVQAADSPDLANKLGFWSLQGGTPIPSNANLNDYKNAGNYYISGNSTAGTISNMPIQRAGTLTVDKGTGTDYPRQTFRLYHPQDSNNGGNTYIRVYDPWNGSGAWGAWHCIGGSDAIIAGGTTNGWVWKKYANGTCEMYKNHQVTNATFSGTGLSGMTYCRNTISLPFAVNGGAIEVNQLATSGGLSVLFSTVKSGSGTSMSIDTVAQNASSGSFILLLNVCGSWK